MMLVKYVHKKFHKQLYARLCDWLYTQDQHSYT